MNADGAGVTRLTNNAAFDGFPSWSPDGTKIAFESARDGNFEIYTMNADGTGVTRLTNNAASDEEPDWGPLTAPAPSNNAPIANAGPDQTINEGTSVTLDGSSSSDPDNDALTYSWIQVVGPTVTLSSANTASPTFNAPLVDTDTILTFQLIVNDGKLDSAPAAVNVVIKNVLAPSNNPPVANAGPDQTVNDGSSITLDGSASSDLDGDALTFKWTQVAGPTVTLTGASTATPSFTAPFVDNDTVLTFQLIVNDGTFDSIPAAVNVIIKNAIPSGTDGKITFSSDRVNLSNAIFVMNADGTGQTDISKAGADHNPSWSPDGTKIAFDSNSGGNDEIFTNTINADGQGVIRLTINAVFDESPSWSPDGTKIAFESARDGNFEIYTMNADGTGVTRLTNNAASDEEPDWGPLTAPAPSNNAPIANAGPDQTINEGTSVTLDGSSSSDPDNDALTYSWIQVVGPTVTLSSANTASPTFNAPLVDTDTILTFQLIVNDGKLDSAPAAVNVVIKNVLAPSNNPPVANAGPDQTVNDGSSITLDGSASSDLDGDALTFKWTQVAGPTVTLTGASTATPSFTAPFVDNDPDLTFQLIVNDGTFDSIPAAVNVIIKNAIPSGTDGKITFSSDRVNLSNAIFVMNADGTGQTDISKAGADHNPSWSPDGTKIAFDRNSGGNDEIYTMNANGTGQTRLTNELPGFFDESPRWSPDGTKIAFESTRDGNLEIYTMNADGTGVTRLTNNAASDEEPDWGPLTAPAPSNNPPIANAGTDQTINEGTSVTLDGSSSSDPDNDALTYSWIQIVGPTVTLSSANTASPTFNAPLVDTDTILTFQLIVNDGKLDSAPAAVNVVIKNVLAPSNNPPEANAGPDQTVNDGSSITLDGSASSDLDGDALSFKWTQVAGPTVTLTGASTATPSFTAPFVDNDTVLTFQLIVNDGTFDSIQIGRASCRERV